MELLRNMAPSAVDEDYYTILELPHTASLNDIIKNYHRLAKACHPDRNANKAGATACFQRVS